MVPLCRDCKHRERTWLPGSTHLAMCHAEVDPVTGGPGKFCSHNREFGPCGPGGLQFEPRRHVRRPPQHLPHKVAGWLPRWLVYYCALRLVANATTGRYGNQIVSELSAMDALDRWRVNEKA